MAQRSDRSDHKNQEELKNEMMEEFKPIMEDEGRKIVNQASILILPKWDIANAMAFDKIRKSRGHQYILEDKARLEFKGSDFIDGHATLAIWSIEKGPRRPAINDINPNLKGGLITNGNSDTSSVEATKLNVDMTKLAHETTKREAKEK